MTPEYIESLADTVDPGQLWRTPALERDGLTEAQRQQMDAGVALRRHADHLRRLLGLLGTDKSLVITPLSASGVATMTIPTPENHLRLVTGHKLNPSTRSRRSTGTRDRGPAR